MAANGQTMTSTILPRPRGTRTFGLTEQEITERREKQLRAAQRLCERLSQVPFYAERAKNNPHYWYDLAASAVNV